MFKNDQWVSDHGKPGLVSVVVASYNGECLIIEALESIKRQTYRPIEVIVIDDGSTDLTGKVVRNWAGKNESDEFIIMAQYGFQTVENNFCRRRSGVTRNESPSTLPPVFPR